MSSPETPPIPEDPEDADLSRRLRCVEQLILGGLLGWRCLVIPGVQVWRDWFCLTCACWLFSALVRDGRIAELGLILFSTALFLLYLSGQAPQTWSVLRPSP